MTEAFVLSEDEAVELWNSATGEYFEAQLVDYAAKAINHYNDTIPAAILQAATRDATQGENALGRLTAEQERLGLYEMPGNTLQTSQEIRGGLRYPDVDNGEAISTLQAAEQRGWNKAIQAVKRLNASPTADDAKPVWTIGGVPVDRSKNVEITLEEYENLLRIATTRDAPSADAEVERFLAEVRAELIRARSKFPGDRIMGLALAEEFGELCKAMLDESAENVRKEAVQTAVMCARVVLDGDGSVIEWRKERGLDPLIAASAPKEST